MAAHFPFRDPLVEELAWINLNGRIGTTDRIVL
jgi:hypothetical protein